MLAIRGAADRRPHAQTAMDTSAPAVGWEAVVEAESDRARTAVTVLVPAGAFLGAASEEARKPKYSGTVLLSVVVDQEGRARDIHVLKSLGMGLDEKAIETVRKWKFKPRMKGGQAVNVRAQIEVNFRLW
jgi:TonB family protein